jgi:hypothetical protein
MSDAPMVNTSTRAARTRSGLGGVLLRALEQSRGALEQSRGAERCRIFRSLQTTLSMRIRHGAKGEVSPPCGVWTRPRVARAGGALRQHLSAEAIQPERREGKETTMSGSHARNATSTARAVGRELRSIASTFAPRARKEPRRMSWRRRRRGRGSAALRRIRMRTVGLNEPSERTVWLRAPRGRFPFRHPGFGR